MVQLVRCLGLRLPDGRRADVLWPVKLHNLGDAAVIDHLIRADILPQGFECMAAVLNAYLPLSVAAL
jgi:hypothetical protein